MTWKAHRRALVVAAAVWAISALGAVAVSTLPLPVSAAHCKHKPCDPPPKNTPPADTPPDHPNTPKATQAQSVALPSATPYDNASATPGPVVGTLITPRPVLDIPAAAPSVIAHPQEEPGLTALIIAASVLGFLMLLSLTVAIAMR
jgi:hypothetical protein